MSTDVRAYPPAEAPMEGNVIAGTIRRYIVDEFLLGVDEGFTADTPLVEGGVVDSMGIMEIVDFIEDHFDIAIDESELVFENLGSVAQMSAFVSRKLDGGPARGSN
jgi:acyl carrier protein